MIRSFATIFLLATASLFGAEIKKQTTDLLIVGATESGWAAAIQAARSGVKSITIVHDGEWFGGQYTEQSLACVDENKGVGKVGWGPDWHPMKRSFQRSGLFKELMDRIETHNTEKYGSPMPGKPHHGPSTFRPAEAEAIFRDMIQPFIDSGQVTVIWKKYPVAATVKNSRLEALTFAPIDLATGKSGEPDLEISTPLTIDASDWGDVVRVSGAEYFCGPDPQSRFGEPSAPTDISQNPPNEMNPITWPMIVAESESETPIEKPDRFDDRNFPRATHLSRAEFGKLEWDVPNPGVGSIPHWPDAGKESARQLSIYTVRRIVDGYISKDGKTSILLNYMNGQDYALERLPKHVIDELNKTGAAEKNIVEMTREERQIIFEDAKRHSRSVLYHLQNFVHERAPDKTNSFRKFHLSGEFGTADNLPPKPYIRESLRLKAMYIMREQDGRNRDSETKTGAKPRFAHVMYPDGLFAWQFHYDFHRTGRTYLKSEGNSGPWIDYFKKNRHTKFLSDRCVFPLRSLIPVKMDGLIGAQGNVGNSSIVSAAIRLHDQRVHVGQAAGATAAVALREKIDPREMVYSREKLEAVRHELCRKNGDAVPIQIWPFRDLDPAHTGFVAINRLAALGVIPHGPRDVDFKPDEIAGEEWGRELRANLAEICPPIGRMRIGNPTNLTRAQLCEFWWEKAAAVGVSNFAQFPKKSDDCDGDGIPDAEDALLFTPNEPVVFEIEKPKLTPETDGVPEKAEGRFFNFEGPASGRIFDADRGHGWQRNLSENHRKRNAVKGPQDSFVFTRATDVWECELENGRYRITVCVGDSDHEQKDQTVKVEGQALISNASTVSGQYVEKSVETEIKDGKLTLEIGSGISGSNTCLNWIHIATIK